MKTKIYNKMLKWILNKTGTKRLMFDKELWELQETPKWIVVTEKGTWFQAEQGSPFYSEDIEYKSKKGM